MTSDDHGLRTSIGMRLSKILRLIGDEASEVQGLDCRGKQRTLTNAEALARTIWRLALGGKETEEVYDAKSGDTRQVTRTIKPDNTMIALIWDRLEGKVSPDGDKKKRRKLVDRVNDQTKKRLNALVEKE